jgi:peptide/nickel transport system substrate-binding protein
MRDLAPRRAVLCAALAAVCFVLSACGGSGDSSGETLRGTYAVAPDYLDPSLSLTLEGWTALQNSYLPLLTYAHKNGLAGTKLIPALARDLPEASDGGRRYTLYLRHGLEYSDGTPVRASDFKFSIERLFRLNSGGASLYDGIVGAERFEKTHKGGISGIGTDDRSGRIVIRLKEPSGVFPDKLGLLYAAVLPSDTPEEDQTAHPPPATGPYVITHVKVGRAWEYRRNPVWASRNSKLMPALPSGHVDAIKIAVVHNQNSQVAEIEQGKSDWMKNPPPPARFGELERRFDGTQFRAEPTISVFYFWMNTQRPPFDDVRVRRAVNYALDPAALERIYSGTIRASQQVLPPGMPGYRPYQPYPHDLAKAKRLVAEADPRDRDITVWAINIHPNDEAGEYYAQVLERLGFHVKLKLVAGANYFTLIGNRATPELDTGWGNWLLDYPHPNDYFESQLIGESIAEIGNTNWAQFDDPAVNAKTRQLGREPLGPRQIREYADLDRQVMRQAPWAPFGNITLATFVSSSIDLEKVIVSPIYGQDLTSFEFK